MAEPTDIQEDMMTAPDPDQESEDEEEEAESPGWHQPSGGPDREDMAAEYIAEQEDWPAKTILDINDPARVAVLQQWEHLFPECSHHQEVYDGFLETFMKSRTSVGGESRREYKSILQSMFGGAPEDGKGSMMVGMLAGDMDDD